MFRIKKEIEWLGCVSLRHGVLAVDFSESASNCQPRDGGFAFGRTVTLFATRVGHISDKGSTKQTSAPLLSDGTRKSRPLLELSRPYRKDQCSAAQCIALHSAGGGPLRWAYRWPGQCFIVDSRAGPGPLVLDVGASH